MSGKRVPKIGDLASLSRDEWETVCHDLCAVIYDTERVEDRLGRGNGLDAIRDSSAKNSTEGWQFRRYDDRLGSKQVEKLREAVDRAVAACRRDLGATLVEFTVFGNLDLQPGHGKAKGEDARFREFQVWCRTQHGVVAKYKGVTWVRSRLLKHPHLKPELFEDLPAAIDSAKEEILKAIRGEGPLKAALEELKARSEGQLAVLAEEAARHLQRGRERGRLEEFLLAIESLRDAERLAKAPGVDPKLLANIHAVLVGVLYVCGQLREAIVVGREAVQETTALGTAELMRLSMGNLALALSDAQQYGEARSLFLSVLKLDEDAGELGEIVRTLSNLLSVDVRLKNWDDAARWARRLEPAIRRLDSCVGPSETSVNALGNVATFHLDMAHELPMGIQAQAFQVAADMFGSMVSACRLAKLQRTEILAESNVARALWFLHRYGESNDSFERSITLSDELGLGKVSADCRVNQGLMLSESGNTSAAVIAVRDAAERYKRIGDDASLVDAEELLSRLTFTKS